MALILALRVTDQCLQCTVLTHGTIQKVVLPRKPVMPGTVAISHETSTPAQLASQKGWVFSHLGDLLLLHASLRADSVSNIWLSWPPTPTPPQPALSSTSVPSLYLAPKGIDVRGATPWEPHILSDPLHACHIPAQSQFPWSHGVLSCRGLDPFHLALV